MHLGFNVSLTLSVVPLETQMAILAGLYLGFALLVVLIAGPGRLSQRSESMTTTRGGGLNCCT